MQKDLEIIIFGMIHILCFTLIYNLWFYDLEIDAFILFFLISTIISLPSFIIVCILHILNTKRHFLGDIWFYIISIICLCITIYFFRDIEDEKNLYPIFEEAIYIFLIIAILSHSIAFGIIHLIKKLPNKTVD